MYYRNALVAVVAAASAGCALEPHNDVLIFGTNTKLAIDISASASSGGVPELTVGYKRQEAVWAPLIANGVSPDVLNRMKDKLDQEYDACKSRRGAKVEDCLKSYFDAVKYVSERATNNKGDPMQQRDAYSVCASFRSNFSGGAGSAGGGIGQWFATGIAAQQLCDKNGLVDALKVETGDNRIKENLRQQNEQQQETIDAIIDAQLETERSMLEQIFECAAPDDSAGDARWKVLINSARGSIDGPVNRLYDDLENATTKGEAEARFQLLSRARKKALTERASGDACPER